jgi:hypothetical protein
MKCLTLVFLMLPLLAGCATDGVAPPPVQVTVSGPVFPASQFKCGTRPLPPDQTTVGSHAASAASHYETALDAHDRRCVSKLNSVGRQLNAAGQVVGMPTKAPPAK